MSGTALRVFGRPSSSNTQKVLWMLQELGRPFELVLASARLGPSSQLLCEHSGGRPFGVVDTDEYVQMCPTRRIPTLQARHSFHRHQRRREDGDLAVWESHSILRYLAEQYRPELHLDTPQGMARCSPWMDWVLDSAFNLGCNHDLVDQMARTPPELRDFELLARSHGEYLRRFQLVEDRLAVTNAFLAGDRFTIADIPMGAELTRWSCSLERWAREAERGAAPAPPAPLPALPGMRGLFRRLQARPAFLRGCLSPEREHLGLPGLREGAVPVPLFGEEPEE